MDQKQSRLGKPEVPVLDSAIGLTRQPRWKLVPRRHGFLEPSVKQFLRLLQPEKLLCHRLIPRTREGARPNTLSSRHGLGAFPVHTDFATADVPPRYILLAAPRPRLTETLIFDAYELMEAFGLEYLQRCLFLQRGRTSRYCRLLTLPEGNPLFRYNKAVMVPQNREAHEVSNYIETGMRRVCRVNWEEYRIAVIDNWNALHSRDACQRANSIGLFRFAIWGKVHDLDR